MFRMANFFNRLDDDELPEPGTIEWYSEIASEYAKTPSQVARGEWMKSLIHGNKEWVGLGDLSGNYKILDYCAGTGFLSMAFAPYVGKILAIDSARGMTEEFNKVARQPATRNAYPKCELKAVWGDLIHPELKPNSKAAKNRVVWDVDGEFKGFDMVVMSLAIDFFASRGASTSELKGGLQALINRLKHDGTLIIVDIEKTHGAPQENQAPIDSAYYNQAKDNGKKYYGFGSKEVIAALTDLGMEDIDVKEDQLFKWHAKDKTEKNSQSTRANVVHRPMEDREELYFMVRARKGKGYLQSGGAGSISRNKACPCGSGRKFKKCCGKGD